jgi:hypothetical protein
MKNLTLIGLLLCSLAQTSYAGLIGTEISLKAIFQASSSSSIETIGFLTTAIVVEPGVEFPSINDFEVEGSGSNLVDVSINVGDDFIEIDFSNVSSGRFASSFENTYVFKFDNVASVNLTGAEIDNSVTTLALASSDVRFTGNELFVNVESLTFNSSTFVRINLNVESSINTTQCLPKDSTIGTISPSLNIHMPYLNYQSLDGTQNLWAYFEYYGQTNDGELLWKLKEYGVNQQ